MQPGMPMDSMQMQMQMQQGMQPGMQGSGLTGGLPPIEQQRFGNLGPGVQDLSALRTPHGGIRTAKKTKQQKKEDMHNKKRSRKVLSKQLLSMDFGLMAPPESESSDDDMFTGSKSGGETNKGFVPSADDKASFTVETEKAEKKEEEEKEEKKEEDPPPPTE